MDYLSRFLSHLEEMGKLKGVRFNDDQNVTHLLFANDILLFIKDHDESIDNMRFDIHLFELVSGLNVNMNKSMISLINVDSHRTNCVATKWWLTSQFLPINYLGVPLGGKPLSKNFRAEVYEKSTEKSTEK